jgi:site-specific DNA-methyltransferase (adenine-specific)
MTQLSTRAHLSAVGRGTEEKRPSTKANEAMHPYVMPEEIFTSRQVKSRAYYSDQTAIVLHMDVREGIKFLKAAGVEVNCIITSPPFYGQRDYEVK